MSLRFLAVASMASLAAAQSGTATGYGRFSCSTQNGDLTYSADQTRCDNANLVAPGANDPSTGLQIDGPTPVNPTCFRQTGMGFFCGIAGAACTADENCDNGYCSIPAGAAAGTCQGGFGQVCNGDDSLCTGYLYCTSADFTAAVTCGGIGAYCNDPIVTGLTDAQAQDVFDQTCESGYCGETSGNCAERLAPNAACDPVNAPFACGLGQTCDPTTSQCVNTQGPSQRARARRSLSKRGLCPASHSACAVSGSKAGFECIDVTSNLEQCGACASAGGVDCTALPGVEAVGCVAGQCEVWSCAEGFSWDAATASCQA